MMTSGSVVSARREGIYLEKRRAIGEIVRRWGEGGMEGGGRGMGWEGRESELMTYLKASLFCASFPKSSSSSGWGSSSCWRLPPDTRVRVGVRVC